MVWEIRRRLKRQRHLLEIEHIASLAEAGDGRGGAIKLAPISIGHVWQIKIRNGRKEELQICCCLIADSADDQLRPTGNEYPFARVDCPHPAVNREFRCAGHLVIDSGSARNAAYLVIDESAAYHSHVKRQRVNAWQC